MFKLLAGHCPEVVDLIDSSRFQESFCTRGGGCTPSAIRATLAEYDFTRHQSSWARKLYPDDAHGGPFVSTVGDEETESSPWWYLKQGSERAYLPVVIDKYNPSVQQFLQAHGFSANPDGESDHISSATMQQSCNAALPAFEAALESTLNDWSVPRMLRALLVIVSGYFRGIVCNSVVLRQYLSNIVFTDSSGYLHALVAVGIIVTTVTLGALN